MKADKYLAVDPVTGELWIEHNESAINAALVTGMPTKFYPITLDEDNKPRLGEPSGVIRGRH